MKHIVHFSGGKDSTAMLLRMIEENMHIDEILFCDTTAEHDELYTHIKKVEKYINKKITILHPKHNFAFYMFDYIKTKGKRKGSKGYSFPSWPNRWCTRLFKIQPTARYLKKYPEKTEYIGITYNEIKRYNKNQDKKRNIKHPLVEWKMTNIDTLQYCYDHGFDWDGLYTKFDRCSCWCCPLQNLSNLYAIYKYYPKKWTLLKEWESKTYQTFRKGETLLEREKKFKKNPKIHNPPYPAYTKI